MSRRASNVVNADELAWSSEGSPDGRFAFGRKRLALEAGARGIGGSLVRLPAGKRLLPKHWHAANEEALYVLAGTGTVTVGSDEIAVRAGDWITFLPGDAHVHSVRNDGPDELLFLALSTMHPQDIVVYPDSGKLGVMCGSAPGGRIEERTYQTLLRTDASAGYWDGE
jgi:uncharacterized cupin superfamily protein